jgi:hypothetical protein
MLRWGYRCILAVTILGLLGSVIPTQAQLAANSSPCSDSFNAIWRMYQAYAGWPPQSSGDSAGMMTLSVAAGTITGKWGNTTITGTVKGNVSKGRTKFRLNNVDHEQPFTAKLGAWGLSFKIDGPPHPPIVGTNNDYFSDYVGECVAPKIQLFAQTVAGPVRVSRLFRDVPTVIEAVFEDPQPDSTNDLTVTVDGRDLKVTATRDPQDYRRFVTDVLVPAPR